jgi:hypothetical protein
MFYRLSSTLNVICSHVESEREPVEMLGGINHCERTIVDIDNVHYFRIMSGDSLTGLVEKQHVKKFNIKFKIRNRKIVFIIYLYQNIAHINILQH